MDYELVPPGNHRRNIAKGAIQTAKNHFTALPHAPVVSPPTSKQKAAQHAATIQRCSKMHGFMRHPWAPLGSEMLMHKPATKRKSWDKHATLTWNLRTSTENYRCFVGYVKKTRAECVSDTVFIKHAHLTQPILTKEDAVIAAAKKLNATLKGTVPKESQQYQSLQNFAKIFEMIANEKAAAKVSKAKTNGIRKVQGNGPILPEYNKKEEEGATPR
ncbi:LOW QUALITY PROTEIN: hypothetical protein ACHAWF_004111, partial [Thalassiosira exigua]